MSLFTVSNTSQLTSAVSNALPGDTILLLPGTYSPSFNNPGSMMININTPGLRLISAVKNLAVLNGLFQCHSLISLGQNSAGTTIDGLKIINGIHGGIWSNSLGGQDLLIKNCEIAFISRMVDTTQYGNDGIYTDTAANFTVEDCLIHDIGRTNDAGNSYDHGIYTHGTLHLRNSFLTNMFCGWHVQTAQGFSGEIEGNTFSGSNHYDQKPGQIMLWNAAGVVSIRKNKFISPNSSALTTVGFSSPAITVDDNIVVGATLGAPVGAIARGNIVI
jgi:hypothetical protein